MNRATEYRHNGRVLTPGTEFSVSGTRGRFTFLAHVVADDGEWVDCYGGRDGYGHHRSFRPELIKTVHRTTKRRPMPVVTIRRRRRL